MTESGICAFVCARERERKSNSFEITISIFRAYKKCKSPIQKEFLKGLLTNTPFFFTLETVLKLAKEKKGDVESIYMQE